MKTKKPLLLVALLVCALAFLLFAATASAQAAEQPFKGSVNGQVWYDWVMVGTPAAHPVQSNSWAVGTLGRFGRVTMSSYHATPPLGQDDFGPGTMVLTLLKSGYKIYATYTGSAHFVPGNHPALLKGSSSFVITGGTGPFADATGEGTMTLKLHFPGPAGLGPDSPPWKSHWTMEGTISY
jgi:hypothetical protein